MNHYLVTWTIDVDAANPKAAAEEALYIQREAETIAHVFTVCDLKTKKKTVVDLDCGKED